MFIDIHTHSREKIDGCLKISSFRYPDEPILSSTPMVRRCAAIHPWDAIRGSEKGVFEAFEAIAPTLFAIGEVGLDRLRGDFECQQELFTRQLELASALGKVVVIHCVRAHNEVLEQLKSYKGVAVIIHSFVGSKEIARRYIAHGAYLSISPLSLRSEKSVEALREVPIERLFIESDDSGEAITDVYQAVSQSLVVSVDVLKVNMMRNFTNIFNNEF